jgi:mRNA interferase MazF
VIAALQGNDVILCQITSQAAADPYSIHLDHVDFVIGRLNQSSRIRPNRVFTADSGIIVYRAGRISLEREGSCGIGVERAMLPPRGSEDWR